MYCCVVVENTLMRDHLRSMILDAAASVIAEKGEAASMSDVAAAAGVSRASLYRHFASRDDLLRGLSAAAIDDAGARLHDADLEGVSVLEAVARMSRALIACGVKYAVTTEQRSYLDADQVTRQIGEPVRAVFQRGIDDGTFRGDLSAEILSQLWGGLIDGAVRSLRRTGGGGEHASALVTSVFLEGATQRT